METSHLIVSVILIGLQLGILAVLWRLLKYLHSVRLTTDESNASAIASIAGDMNRLSKSVGIMLGAAAPDDAKAKALEDEGSLGSLSDAEKRILAAQRKAELWRGASRRRSDKP